MTGWVRLLGTSLASRSGTISSWGSRPTTDPSAKSWPPRTARRLFACGPCDLPGRPSRSSAIRRPARPGRDGDSWRDGSEGPPRPGPIWRTSGYASESAWWAGLAGSAHPGFPHPGPVTRRAMETAGPMESWPALPPALATFPQPLAKPTAPNLPPRGFRHSFHSPGDGYRYGDKFPPPRRRRWWRVETLTLTPNGARRPPPSTSRQGRRPVWSPRLGSVAPLGDSEIETRRARVPLPGEAGTLQARARAQTNLPLTYRPKKDSA